MKLTPKQQEQWKLCTGPALEIYAYGGSRSGKTTLYVDAMVCRALKEPASRHVIVREHLIDVRQSCFLDTYSKYMDSEYPQLQSSKQYVENRQDWYVKFPNKSEIWFAGLDDKKQLDKVLGREYSTIFINEASQISYASYNKIKTRLAQRNKLAKKIYIDANPPSKGHWTYKRFFEFKDPDTGQPVDQSKLAKILMNPVDNLENISEEYIGILENLPESEKLRFLYGQYSDVIAGAVYGKQLNTAAIERRLDMDLEPVEGYPVYAIFDIGTSDATSAWIVQFLKDRILCLSYFEDTSEGFPYYWNLITEAGWHPSKIYLPHDARNKSWASGKTTREVVEKYGEVYGFNVELLPKLGLWDGINAARDGFHKCYFDTKCEKGVNALKSYRTEWDERNGIYSREPLHDWSSHGSDGFRYIHIAYKQNEITAPRKQEEKTGYTYNDILERMKQRRQQSQD